MSKLDGPERTATIKPVFSQNEVVVVFDYCIIAAGATSVPFTSGASHCSELANSVLDVVWKTYGFKCFQGFLSYHSLSDLEIRKEYPIVSWKHSPSSCQRRCQTLYLSRTTQSSFPRVPGESGRIHVPKERGLIPHPASISRVTICFRSRSVGLRSEEVSQSSTTNLSSLFDNRYHSNWSFACHFEIMFLGNCCSLGCFLCWSVSPICVVK